MSNFRIKVEYKSLEIKCLAAFPILIPNICENQILPIQI